MTIKFTEARARDIFSKCDMEKISEYIATTPNKKFNRSFEIEGVKHKACARCYEIKPEDDFYRHKNTKAWNRRAECKECYKHNRRKNG